MCQPPRHLFSLLASWFARRWRLADGIRYWPLGSWACRSRSPREFQSVCAGQAADTFRSPATVAASSYCSVRYRLWCGSLVSGSRRNLELRQRAVLVGGIEMVVAEEEEQLVLHDRSAQRAACNPLVQLRDYVLRRNRAQQHILLVEERVGVDPVGAAHGHRSGRARHWSRCW